MTTKVILQFLDEQDMRRFAGQLEDTYVEINTRNLTIECECSPETIELATGAFNAKVV